jgi:hypothetical protein
MSDVLFRSLRLSSAVAKCQPANDNRTLQQRLEASLALELAKARRQGGRLTVAVASTFLLPNTRKDKR